MNETKGFLPRTQALIEEPGYEANSEPDIIYSGVDYPIGSNCTLYKVKRKESTMPDY